MTTKPYRIHIAPGRAILAGKDIIIEASDEWQARAVFEDALPGYAGSWPVYHAPGTLDMFGAETVDTITLDEAREALKADAGTTQNL